MKDWPENHPKAKLMAQKRAAILVAARQIFLRDGYNGASMETIAATAEVSIMTLYRHAANKEDLFTAVIIGACTPPDGDKRHSNSPLRALPLAQLLEKLGMLFQAKMADPDTVALLRVVIIESTRFPHLAMTAYQTLIASWNENLNYFLSEHADFSAIPAQARHGHVDRFFNDLVGIDTLRTLLGLDGSTAAEQQARAAQAAATFIDALRR